MSPPPFPSHLRDLFPASQHDMWARWLGYRIPHWRAMERAVAKTLVGSAYAVVRVGWDSSVDGPDEWHATFFTLTDETPDRDQAMAAAAEFKPAGVVLHHVVTDTPHPDAAAPCDPRPAELASLVDRALSGRRALADRERASWFAPATLERLRRTSDETVERARSAVERAITDGLRARWGFPLIPPAIVKPEMMGDWILYRLTLTLREKLASFCSGSSAWWPRGIGVCRACTMVFAPRRRSFGEFCHLCCKRPAEPFVVGQRTLEPGTRQTVRTPKLAGTMILGWTTTTIGLCPECETPFMGRRDATACPGCANRVRQRRHRRSRGNAGG